MKDAPIIGLILFMAALVLGGMAWEVVKFLAVLKYLVS